MGPVREHDRPANFPGQLSFYYSLSPTHCTWAETVYRQRNGLDAQSEIFNRGEQKSISHGSGIFPTGSEGTECIDWGEALHEHRFGRPHRGETEKLVVRSWINKTLLFVAVSLVALVIIGCTVPSFSLEILGIVGIAVESGQGFEDATTHHSVFTVIKLLMEEARFLDTAGDYIGLGTLSMLLVFSVLLVPIVQSLALLRQWFSPCTRKERARKSIFIEILQAWQYAEVYLIAIFVASW